jgi:hypothetical protein
MDVPILLLFHLIKSPTFTYNLHTAGVERARPSLYSAVVRGIKTIHVLFESQIKG